MVSSTSIIFMVLTALVTTLGPIIAAIVFYRKQKYYVGSVFTGAAVFFLFQMVLRIPILQLVLPKMEWYQHMAQNSLWGYALFLGFTAGLFEEVGRYLAFTTILKKRLDWKNAVAFGIGHSGIESILLVGLTYVSNILVSITINSGVYDSMTAQYPQQAEALIQTKNTLIGTPSYMYLLGGAERIFTFFIHIALSVLIMVGIRKKKGLLYLGLAILLHMVIDSPVVILSAMGVNILFIEALVFVFAVISLLYIRDQRKKENVKNTSMLSKYGINQADDR
ncbi:MAG: YhfC family intramembrane metalloprotease [Clostridiaceae bacterium]|nr:YhfC family intramembrane metalloprotease [Clostridiaceae bacterium]